MLRGIASQDSADIWCRYPRSQRTNLKKETLFRERAETAPEHRLIFCKVRHRHRRLLLAVFGQCSYPRRTTRISSISRPSLSGISNPSNELIVGAISNWVYFILSLYSCRALGDIKLSDSTRKSSNGPGVICGESLLGGSTNSS